MIIKVHAEGSRNTGKTAFLHEVASLLQSKGFKIQWGSNTHNFVASNDYTVYTVPRNVGEVIEVPKECTVRFY